MRLHFATFSIASALLGLTAPAFSQVYRLVPNQASEGYRLHTPNGQTYNIAPNYGMREYGKQPVPQSYTIKRVPGGNGDRY